MNRFVFLLGFLLMALMTVTLQAQKIIPLWQNNMPNSKGIVLKDSVVRERVVQVGIPAVHVYEPSKAERTGTAVLIIPGGGYVKLAHEISGIALAKWYNTLGVTAFCPDTSFPAITGCNRILQSSFAGWTTCSSLYTCSCGGIWNRYS